MIFLHVTFHICSKLIIFVSLSALFLLAFPKKCALKTKAKPRNKVIVPITMFLLKFVLSSTDSELKPN